ncbi:type II toxin-antitoxin system HigA family antitoxin [Vibrio hepatarius]|uniref:helix-turn-helix domain-containing protein n=1 Tax=Vibrio hepatarius TaxID=171383 RepID=UPI003735B513
METLELNVMKEVAITVHNSFPWLEHGIQTEQEYNHLLSVMDTLVEDYESNSALINLLFPVIEKYEEEAEQFAEFNANIDNLDDGVAILRVLIDQYKLTQSDFKEEIGAKSTVSMILNGHRELTLNHIRALSKRFDIPAALFV